MDWLVLRKRRHEGPYTDAALRDALAHGRLNPEDYGISVTALEAGQINYTPLKKILNLPDQPALKPATEPLLAPVGLSAPLTASAPTARSTAGSSPTGPIDLSALGAFDPSDFVPIPRKSSSPTASGVVRPREKTATTSISEIASPVKTVSSGSNRGLFVTLGVLAVAALAYENWPASTPRGSTSQAVSRDMGTTSKKPAQPEGASAAPRRSSTTARSTKLRLPELPDARKQNVPNPEAAALAAAAGTTPAAKDNALPDNNPAPLQVNPGNLPGVSDYANGQNNYSNGYDPGFVPPPPVPLPEVDAGPSPASTEGPNLNEIAPPPPADAP